MRVKRFVLDANIWISYFITGKEDELLRIKISNKLVLFSSNELITEIKRVLDYPQIRHYGVNSRAAVRFVKSITVNIALQYPIGQYLDADPDDDYIIATALQANAAYIVSGDKHILSKKNKLESEYSKLRIITKREFEQMFA